MRREKHDGTYLKDVGEIDEHVLSCLLLPTCDVEADGGDVHALAAFRELVLDGEGVETQSGEANDFG